MGRRTIFHGWYVVASCAIVAFYSWGLGFFGQGVYLQALQARHGWSASLVSASITCCYLGSAAIGLIVGGIVDRRGGAPVIAFGAAAMGLGVVALSFVTAPWQLFAVHAVIAASLASLSTTTIGATLLPWFTRYRGRAMAMAMLGNSIGGGILVPLLVSLTATHGFRAATVVAALLLWLSVLPLAVFVVKRRPEDLGSCADGTTGPASAAVASSTSEPGRRWTRAGALRTPSFWMIALPFALGFVVQGGFIVHQLAFLEPVLGATRASFVVTATTLVAFVARIVVGLVADRLERRLLAIVCVTVQGLALALMATVPSPAWLLAGSMAFGLGLGILITMPPLLTQEAFGTASFGTVFAMVNGSMQVGVAVGPSIVGVLRDRGGGYETGLAVLAAVDAVAMALLVWGWTVRLTRRPRP